MHRIRLALAALTELGTLVFIGLAPPAAAAPPGDATPEAFVQWARDTAIPIDRWAVSDDLSAWLDDALRDRRIVFVGEPGHFFQEKYDVQLMLIEHLMDRGYRHLFIEGLGATASEIVDDHVSGARWTAPGTDAEATDAYRARVLGQAPAATDFAQRLGAAQQRFFESLRRLNAERREGAPRLTVHPLDVDMGAGGCRLTIDALLGAHADRDGLQQLRARCARSDDEPVADWFTRLEQVRDDVDAAPARLLAGLTEMDGRRFRQCLDCLVESLAFTVTRQADGIMDRALVRREPAMFRQVMAGMAELPDDAKVIMMAHCNHLSRVGDDTMRARQPSVGEMLTERFPGAVLSIWMLHDHGWLLNPMAPEPLGRLESDPERVESLLVQAGSTYLLPLHTGALAERYLDEPRRLSYFSWYETATLPRQTDAILFMDEISALAAPEE